MDVFGEDVPEGGGVYGDGSVAQGAVLGPERVWEEVCIGWPEVAGRIVVVEQVCEVGRGLVMEGFMGEEEELEVDSMWDREPV